MLKASQPASSFSPHRPTPLRPTHPPITLIPLSPPQVKAAKRHHESTAAFIEEGVVRRELSDNFCFYQPQYDSLAGAAGWAQETLRVHA